MLTVDKSDAFRYALLNSENESMALNPTSPVRVRVCDTKQHEGSLFCFDTDTHTQAHRHTQTHRHRCTQTCPT